MSVPEMILTGKPRASGDDPPALAGMRLKDR